MENWMNWTFKTKTIHQYSHQIVTSKHQYVSICMVGIEPVIVWFIVVSVYNHQNLLTERQQLPANI